MRYPYGNCIKRKAVLQDDVRRGFYSIKSIVIACLGAVILYGASAPMVSLNAYRVDSDNVLYRMVTSQNFSFRFEAKSADGTQSGQHLNRQSPDYERRFLYIFEDDIPFETARSVYIPSAGGELKILINGGNFVIGKPHDLWAPAYGRHGLSVDIPRHVMLPGRNRLDIYTTDDRNRTGLGPVYLGPTALINAAIDQDRRRRAVLPLIGQIGAALAILLAVIGIVIGARKTRYVVLGLLGCAALAQAGLSLLAPATLPPALDTALRLGFPVGVIGLTAILWMSQTRYGRGVIFTALCGIAIIGPLMALWTLLSPIYVSLSNFSAVLNLWGVFPVVLLWGGQQVWRDLALRKSRLETLKQTISEQSDALDEKTKTLVSEMRRRALLEERGRFTRDIHDGIGGQFLSLLLRVRTGSVEREDIAEELQAGLHDLRLVVDSLDNTDENLTEALLTFRARVTPQLAAAKIKLIWHQPHPLSAKLGNTGGILNLYRILQEIVTNTMRHSKASELRLSVIQAPGADRLDIVTEDNGVGFDDADSQNTPDHGVGKGLPNMKKRAADLGATLTISAMTDPSGGKTGTRTALSVPVTPEPEPDASIKSQSTPA